MTELTWRGRPLKELSRENLIRVVTEQHTVATRMAERAYTRQKERAAVSVDGKRAMTDTGWTWYGEAVEEMTREELIAALAKLNEMYCNLITQCHEQYGPQGSIANRAMTMSRQLRELLAW